VAVRVSHVVGMAKGGANRWRLVGAAGTWMIMLGLSFWAMVRAVTY
jgi:hypothetical protein